jgi:hypothetical protein
MNRRLVVFVAVSLVIAAALVFSGCDKLDIPANRGKTATAQGQGTDVEPQHSLIQKRKQELRDMAKKLPTPTKPKTMKSPFDSKWVDSSGYWPGEGPYKFPMISIPAVEDQPCLQDPSVNHRVAPLGVDVPSDVLKKISTKDLAETCLRDERAVWGILGTLQDDYRFMQKRTNCLRELPKRDDAGEKLLEIYQNTPVNVALSDTVGDQQDGTPAKRYLVRTRRLNILHMMLTDPKILKKMHRRTKLLLLSEAVKNGREIQTFGPLGQRMIDKAVCLIVHLLYEMRYPPFLDERTANKSLAAYMLGTGYSSISVAEYEKFLKMAETALKNPAKDDK